MMDIHGRSHTHPGSASHAALNLLADLDNSGFTTSSRNDYAGKSYGGSLSKNSTSSSCRGYSIVYDLLNSTRLGPTTNSVSNAVYGDEADSSSKSISFSLITTCIYHFGCSSGSHN